MTEKEECVKVGLIAKPHGVNGEVVVRADAGFCADDLCYEFLLLEIDGGLVPFYAEEVRIKSSEEILVKFEFVESHTDARRLSGCNVYVRREWTDETSTNTSESNLSIGFLVGYQATDKQAGTLGIITDIDNQVGANPLFVISHNNDELLVPIADEFIVSINDKQKTILFDLPEGLIDL